MFSASSIIAFFNLMGCNAAFSAALHEFKSNVRELPAINENKPAVLGKLYGPLSFLSSSDSPR
jgi:hypothetical protein